MKGRNQMKSKLIVFVIIVTLILSLASCVGGNKNTHKKNPTGTFKSDSDDYVIPGIFIDVHEGEKSDDGDGYGPINPIK